MNWIELKDIALVKEIKEASERNPDRIFTIFKHSTHCGTSRIAKNLFESEWTAPDAVHLVNVIESRAVSNAISSLFNVRHESPQVLLIKNGAAIYNNSHSGIDAQEIVKMLESEPTR